MLSRRGFVFGSIPLVLTASTVTGYARPSPIRASIHQCEPIDSLAFAAYRESVQSDGWLLANVGDEPYLIRSFGRPNKIVAFLHSWSENQNQVTIFKELHALQDAIVISPNFGGPNKNSSALGSHASTERIMRVIGEVRRKTGIERVQLIGFSGGGMAGLLLLGRHPNEIEKASLWVPIFDLASLWATTSNPELKRDMLTVIGAPPSGPDDPGYLSRSPRSCMNNFSGFTSVTVNVGTLDTEVPKKNGEDACGVMSACAPGADVRLIEWSDMGHEFRAAEAVKQLHT